MAEKRSSDDSRDSAESEEDLFLQPNELFSRPKAKLVTVPRIIIGLLVLLIVLNIGLLATLSAKTFTPSKHEGIVDYYLQTAKGKMPPTVTRIYHDYDDNFLDHNITVATRYWKGLFPPGDGIIGLSNNEIEKLGIVKSVKGMADPSRSIYLVGAFHQLHCLSVLRAQTIKLWKNPDYSIKDPTYYHTMHCVDVLRQLIMCAADGTLMFKRPEDKYPGEAGQRTCRNFDALTEWTTERQYLSVEEDPDFNQ